MTLASLLHRILCRLGSHVWHYSYMPDVVGGTGQVECLCCGAHEEFTLLERDISELAGTAA